MNIKGLLFLLFLTIAATISLLLLSVCVITIPLHFAHIIRLRRKWASFLAATYFDFGAALLITLCGTKVFVYSENNELEKDEGCLIICNHRSTIDWLYSGWCYGFFMGTNAGLKIILKESLKYIPIYGWAAQLMMWIFLRRKREQDIPHLQKALSYLWHFDTKPTIFIFPEGTDLSSSNITKSNQFARTNNLKEMGQVLYPKLSGLICCLDFMRGRGLVLHDITIAFKDNRVGKRTTAFEILKGNFPREVHLYVRRFKIDELPNKRKEFEMWLRDLFYFKEALLTEFYESGSTPCLDPNDVTRKIKWSKPLIFNKNKMKVILQMTIIILITSSLIYFIDWIRWSSMLMIILGVSSRFFDGFDSIELEMHGEMFTPESDTDD